MNYSGLMMTARDIDADGNWHHQGDLVPLVGATVPVPETARLRGEDEEQEIFMLVKATDFISHCYSCEKPLPDHTILLLTQHAKMMPAHCCDTIIWMTDEREYDGRNDT
jgi:hypothetical protein